MSCTSTNPCLQDECTCENPCYDNCGCLNPTTFECTTKPGACAGAGVTDTMNGKEALAAYCLAITELQGDSGKILVDVSDTCPDYASEKIVAGLNISIDVSGEGCDRVMTINATEGGVPVDVKAKVSATDTTSDYLNNKIVTGTYISKTINNPAGDEEIELDVVPVTLISTDAGNAIVIGTDGGLKTNCPEIDGSETKVVEGTGVIITGTGTVADPYVFSTNPSIQVARSCFDATWRDVTLVATGNPNVVYVSGTPKYRYRFDGSIEFKGSLTFNVAFGAYSTSDRKYTIPVGNIPTTCLTLVEQAGTADLKGINYIDVPQASADQITQMYGYVIRKSAQNLIVEFQSSFTGATSKTVVVNFEGVISHPSI